jgi:hypothetical protein
VKKDFEMKKVVPIISPFDGYSKKPGSAGSARAWRKLCEKESCIEYPREMGPFLPKLLGWDMAEVASRGDVPLCLGGDHSLTFFSVEALTSHYGPLTILHFDAHHDCYEDLQLTNYTVFFHCSRILQSRVISLGVRHDVKEPRPCLLEKDIIGPTFISLDLDYFPPSTVPSVSYPAECAPDCATSFESFTESLARIRGPIVGADIVEWHGAAEESREFQFVGSVLRVLSKGMVGSGINTSK